MVQGQPNRLAEMEVFVAAAEASGFTAAARAEGMTPSAVSKLIARLEDRLGARLFNRSTRKLQLTEEGANFYERAKTILAEIEEAERCAGVGEARAGLVRVSVNHPVGMHLVLPRVGAFLDRYPEIELDISLTDRVVDLLDERADIAIRSGPLADSRLRARKLGWTRLMIVGAPAYFKRHGTPKRPADLDRHHRLGFSYARAIQGWPMREGEKTITVPTKAPVRISDGEALRRLALEGVGLARLAHFSIREDLKAGRLKQVLKSATVHDGEDIHAVFIGDGGPTPARVRAFVDFLAETIGPDSL
ncbi:MAG: LysR family transcriptional regulator [Roseitalea porphyridii]|jgi:DNA-binding transcriptional LysR family regulator|uniref:LysR family transcriptional regulator n=2 Tax=Roseitalea porphyridii TaxID=1852022 RepID=UPI0032EEE567